MGTDTERPALKEIFDEQRIRSIAAALYALDAKFDPEAFFSRAFDHEDKLSLMQRMRRVAHALHQCLPSGFLQALPILDALSRRIGSGFATLFLPEFVGIYGHQHFEQSMSALKRYTQIGSSEFAIRYFLKDDFDRTLHEMEQWTSDKDAHVRRLASEGSRPLLPWATRIPALLSSPPPTAGLLGLMQVSDSSKYVRTSLANHLNDLAKSDPAFVIDSLKAWDDGSKEARFVVHRALRTLVKQGDKRALILLGAGHEPEITVDEFTISPERPKIGGEANLTVALRSVAKLEQKLIVDLRVNYVKASGRKTHKVFKLKTLSLASDESRIIRYPLGLADLATRTHHPGHHTATVMANGVDIAQLDFELVR